MIKLYTFPPSTNSRKVRIALLEKGLEFERINIDLSKREQKNSDYLKIHPFGQVPALDDEGFIIYDSTVINEYLEDEYPYPSLMPKDSEGRARARLMEDFRDTHFNPYFVHLIQEMRKPEGERDAQRIDNARSEITRAFDRTESELNGNEYLAGPFSLADIAFSAGCPGVSLSPGSSISIPPSAPSSVFLASSISSKALSATHSFSWV